MSSSDSESDENTKMLMASVDTNFYSDKMYKVDENSLKDDDQKNESSINKNKPKSNRNIEEVEEIFQSDVNIPPSMQKYVGKRFSEMVAQQIEFVDFEIKNSKKSKKRKSSSNSVYLLKGAPPLDIKKDPLPDLPEMVNKPLDVKRRVIEAESLSEYEKLMSTVIDSELLLSGSDTKYWKSRQKPKVFEYKTKNGISYLREPDTEFTKIRNKNNWTESKIKDFHFNKNKS